MLNIHRTLTAGVIHLFIRPQIGCYEIFHIHNPPSELKLCLLYGKAGGNKTDLHVKEQVCPMESSIPYPPLKVFFRSGLPNPSFPNAIWVKPN